MQPRKQLKRYIELENEAYRRAYDHTCEVAARATLFDVRRGLAILAAMYGVPKHEPAGGAFEAFITNLICRGDAPRLVGSDGRVWA